MTESEDFDTILSFGSGAGESFLRAPGSFDGKRLFSLVRSRVPDHGGRGNDRGLEIRGGRILYPSGKGGEAGEGFPVTSPQNP